jgi:hypothetical protein
MPVNWDTEAEHRLLKFLLATSNASTPDFSNMATFMGSDFSYEAVRYDLSA